MKRKRTIVTTTLVGGIIPIVLILLPSSFPNFLLVENYLGGIYPILYFLFCPVVIPLIPLLGENPGIMPQFIAVLGIASMLNGIIYGALAAIAFIGRPKQFFFMGTVIVCVLGYWTWVITENWRIVFS